MIPPAPRDAIELTTRDLVVLSAPEGDACPDVVVTVAVRPSQDLTRCLDSIAAQDIGESRLGVVVLLDAVTEVPFTLSMPARLQGRAWLLRANCGTPARARNSLLEFVEIKVPQCRWVARLDWDDRFAEPSSLRAAMVAGEAAAADFVLGGNRVLDREGVVLRTNPADARLRDAPSVVALLEQMAVGTAFNELPSCNLLIRNGQQTRYPDTASAEDHWLVAGLLLHRRERVAILDSVLYCDYTLDGNWTVEARRLERHRQARAALHEAARTWLAVRDLPGTVLGWGQEGIVLVHDGTVSKHFYPGILKSEKVGWLKDALASPQRLVPRAGFRRDQTSGGWIASYPWELTRELTTPCPAAVAAFVDGCVEAKLVCGNIKRPNFRVRDDGSLLHVDIGNWIVPMDVSVLRDSSARLYSIAVLDASDDDLQRRPPDPARPAVWDRLPGFAAFYGGVVSRRLASRWRLQSFEAKPSGSCSRRDDVSLLIKACAMDAHSAEAQVRHLVEQLVGPSDFASRVLAVDAYPGPFLRQHSDGDFEALMAVAERLLAEGVLDQVWVAPRDAASIRDLHRSWFGVDAWESHTVEGIPVSPQTWAFDRVATRFVLQCDVDALVGRRDRAHDYLSEMIAACTEADVVGVAFNIPQDPAASPVRYHALAGEWKPEVRCGMLDLCRLRAARPLPNQVVDGKLRQPWYRSLHEHQRKHGLRTLRGGDPRTFYIHPLNGLKSDPVGLARVRDMVVQGLAPPSHWGRWDVGPDVADWRYPRRAEAVVVLARGRNTPIAKLDRFAAGLEMQTDKDFGVVVIDDASSDASPQFLAERLQSLGRRLTLIRHDRPRGRMHNNVIAIREICSNPQAAIVVVDLDDALVDAGAIAGVRDLFRSGHDVVLAAPFRPDVPTKVYCPDFTDPRALFGGDVWIHLRAFAKRLFDQLPDDALQRGERWLTMCDDYATMIPIVELASSPVYVPEFWYWHERTTGRDSEELRQRDAIIREVLGRKSLRRSAHGQSLADA